MTTAPQSAPLTFAFQAAPTSEDPAADDLLYKEVVEDCHLGMELGYEAAWFLEHHFSDYYPTPSPLVFMAHVAAECPTLGLGTSVLVIPWYHPLRLAEEISMVNALTQGTLHIGMGRGTAKMEYDAYGVDMNEARARFAECWTIVETAMTGKPFTFDGAFHKISREIQLRPTPTGKEVKFYGAIGSPGSAAIMAELGLPPLCLAQFPDHLLQRILGNWRKKTEELGRSTERDHPDRREAVHRQDRRGGARAGADLPAAQLRSPGQALRDRRQSLGRHPGIRGLLQDLRQHEGDDRPGESRADHGPEPGRQP